MSDIRNGRAGAILAGVALVLIITFTLVVSQPEPDPFGGDAIEDPPFTPLTYGIQAFLWWDGGHAGLHLDWVRIMNFNHVKQTFAWRSLEPMPGQWDFSQSDRIVDEIERRDLNLVARLGQVPAWAAPETVRDLESDKTDTPPNDLDTWENYCRTVADRYAGRIRAYQIWNEPNLAREWGDQPPDAEAYVDLLRVCSDAIRETDPEAIIISAGLAPTGQHDDVAHRDDIYFDALYRAGFQDYVDVVGVHAPGFTAPDYGPDDAEADGKGRWATFRRVEDLRKIMLTYDDAARQMAILEMGWTTDTANEAYEWFAVTEEQQADYLVEAFDYIHQNWTPWVGLVSVIYLPDPDWTEDTEEYWWAVSTPDNFHRPAWFALVNMPKYCGDYVIPETPPGISEEEYLANLDTCP